VPIGSVRQITKPICSRLIKIFGAMASNGEFGRAQTLLKHGASTRLLTGHSHPAPWISQFANPRHRGLCGFFHKEAQSSPTMEDEESGELLASK
jgi:hypothetical protein